jgi:hypothetical protein
VIAITRNEEGGVRMQRVNREALRYAEHALKSAAADVEEHDPALARVTLICREYPAIWMEVKDAQDVLVTGP